jgi:hypothetical protein
MNIDSGNSCIDNTCVSEVNTREPSRIAGNENRPATERKKAP